MNKFFNLSYPHVPHLQDGDSFTWLTGLFQQRCQWEGNVTVSVKGRPAAAPLAPCVGSSHRACVWPGASLLLLLLLVVTHPRLSAQPHSQSLGDQSVCSVPFHVLGSCLRARASFHSR